MKTDLEIKNASFRYDNTLVLDAISLEYSKRDFLSIIGPNGGGKSTLLKMMIGLLEPTSGSITLFGETPLHVSHRIAYVPQDTLANKDFPIKVLDVVLMGRLSKSKAFSTYSKEDKAIARAMLEKVGMLSYENQKLHALSGGQRHRIAIARAIYTNPQILILDEATSALDSGSEQKITEAIEHLVKDKITFVIAHRLSTIKRADKIILLKHGTIIAMGDDESLRASSEDYLKLKDLQA